MVHGKKKGMKKKYKAGEATQYISRKHARKKLQVLDLMSAEVSVNPILVDIGGFPTSLYLERNLSKGTKK